jgi:hypothetical protein
MPKTEDFRCKGEPGTNSSSFSVIALDDMIKKTGIMPVFLIRGDQ